MTRIIPVALALSLAQSLSFIVLLNEKRKKKRILGGTFIKGSKLGEGNS